WPMDGRRSRAARPARAANPEHGPAQPETGTKTGTKTHRRRKYATWQAEGGRFELPRAFALAVFKTAAFSLTRPPLREASRGGPRKVFGVYQLRVRLQTSGVTSFPLAPARAQAAQRASLLAASSAATL